MSEISSGLVAVAWHVRSQFGFTRCFVEIEPRREHFDLVDTFTPLVRLSDAEAIIAAKDAEILEQCRINGIGAERELALLGQIERQSAALKLARDALESCDVGDCSTSYVVMPSFDAVAIDEAIAAIDALGE